MSREILRELSRMLTREVRDPRVRDVTLTRVELTDDLREATVWFVPLGAVDDAQRIEELREGLAKAARFLQGAVGRKLRLRNTPRLRFDYDKGMNNLLHVHELLADLAGQDEK